jgi:cell fate (sporulation/competence/biofilm development) regulator YlbF (YheA/YmcA/DUF963 family)
VQRDFAADIIEMRVIARKFMRALGTVFELAHTLSDLTGVTFDVTAVASAAQTLAQALTTARTLAKELERTGIGELTRTTSKETDLDLAAALTLAGIIRDAKDYTNALTQTIESIRLIRVSDEVRDRDLVQVLQRLSSVAADAAELDHSFENRAFTNIDLSSTGDIDNTLSNASNQLREVARSAFNLANELDSASEIARRLASARQDLAGAPAALLEFASQLAAAFSAGDLLRAEAMAKSMSELFHNLNEMCESASELATVHDTAEALKARSLIAQLDKLERVFNFARTRNIKRLITDDVSRALDQIVRLAVTPIDASSADLRHLKFSDLDELEGVIWTPSTKWPVGIASEVSARSDEIRPRVYRVRGGNERDPLELAVGV